jgi:hypothetical protein
VRALYCGKVATKKTLEPHTGRDDGMLQSVAAWVV